MLLSHRQRARSSAWVITTSSEWRKKQYCVCVCVCVWRGRGRGWCTAGLLAHERIGNIKSPFKFRMTESYLKGEEMMMIRLFQQHPISFFVTLLIREEIDKANNVVNKHSHAFQINTKSRSSLLKLVIIFGLCKSSYFLCSKWHMNKYAQVTSSNLQSFKFITAKYSSCSVA